MDVGEREDLERLLDQGRRKYERQRQTIYRRSREVLRGDNATQLDQISETSEREVIDTGVMRYVSQRVVEFMGKAFEDCARPLNRTTTMESLLNDPHVYMHLPKYYLRLTKAKIYAKVVKNLKIELYKVKGVQSAEMLAYNGALLNMIVTTGIESGQTSGYSRIR